MGMRLLLVHGIAQQDYTEQQLLGIWTDHLLDHGLDPDLLRRARPEMAYYGDHLHALTQGGRKGAVAMGPETSGDDTAFVSAALDQIAAACGIDNAEVETAATEAAIAEGANAISQSTWAGRRAVAIVSLLERISPLRGRFAAKVVRQAYAYLADRHVRADINDVVRPRLEAEDQTVVVSHSLGTVVAFSILRELAARGTALHVPLFVTLGSPLAIGEVQRWLGGDFAIPANVMRWMNFYDKGDPVTLGRPLGGSFAKGIVDTVVENNTRNGHSIAGYLDDAALIDPLAAALR